MCTTPQYPEQSQVRLTPHTGLSHRRSSGSAGYTADDPRGETGYTPVSGARPPVYDKYRPLRFRH